MNVSKERFKADLKKYFADNEAVSSWENLTHIDEDGDEVIYVGLSKGELSLKEAHDLPTEVDGVKIVYFYQGEVRLLKTTDRYDPVIGGISMGAIDVTAGTSSGIVWKKDTGEPYILTNEHVVSDTQNVDPNHPPKGYPIVQPGMLDGARFPADLVGNLGELGGMKKAALKNIPCNIDGALVEVERDFLNDVFWGIGKVDSLQHAEVEPGDGIVKSGRTTGVTMNTVMAVDVSANIAGIAWNSPVTMEGLIQTRTAFVEGGDSGSRVWKRSTMEPIGIVFAGSWITSFIIPAQTICDKFDVTYGDKIYEGNDPEEPLKKSLFRRIIDWFISLFKKIFS